MVADDGRGGCGEITAFHMSNHTMPSFLAGSGIQRDQVIIRCFEKQVAVIEPDAPVPDVCAAPCLPEVVPDRFAAACIHCPNVIHHRDVEHSIVLEYRAFDRTRVAADGSTRAFSADDQRTVHAGVATESCWLVPRLEPG